MIKNNLIFIMTDHQRADSLYMVQDKQEVTPNLNKLADEATVFTRAYNTCPLCVPARTALATGKNPISNGVVFNDLNGIKANDHKTIHQYLWENGYEVAHVGVNHIRVKPELKNRLNFSKWIDESDYKTYAASKSIMVKRSELDETKVDELVEGEYLKRKYSNTRVSTWTHSEEDFKDFYFTKNALDFIKSKPKKPFALFLYLWAPHPPLILPKTYALKFNSDNISLPSNVGITGKDEPKSRRKGAAAQLADGVSMNDWRKVWSAHLGLVNMADNLIGQVLTTLKEEKLYDDSVIVFTSDHGEHLGQHSMYQKMEMYEQAINVPAIIKTPYNNHQVVNTPISHLDLLPTILDLLQINSNETFEGDSLKDTVINKIAPKEKDIFCQYSGNPQIGDIRRTVISGKYKYIYDSVDIPELYDLEKDPLEMNNLATDSCYKKIIDEMHHKYCCWANKQNDWVIKKI